MTRRVKLEFQWISPVIIFNLLLVPPRIPRSIRNGCLLFHWWFTITCCTVMFRCDHIYSQLFVPCFVSVRSQVRSQEKIYLITH